MSHMGHNSTVPIRIHEKISQDYSEIWKMRTSVRGKRKMDYGLWNAPVRTDPHSTQSNLFPKLISFFHVETTFGGWGCDRCGLCRHDNLWRHDKVTTIFVDTSLCRHDNLCRHDHICRIRQSLSTRVFVVTTIFGSASQPVNSGSASQPVNL